jgi:hypothetical protein
VFDRYLPPSIQVVLVSATLPQEVLDMTKKFMNNPIKVLVKRDELTLEGKSLECHLSLLIEIGSSVPIHDNHEAGGTRALGWVWSFCLIQRSRCM